VWQWDGGVAAGGRLAGLVESRLAEEDPRCRPVLELVACGEPLAVWLVEQLVGPEGLEVAERAGLLEAVPGTDEPAVRFAHPVHRDVLRAALPLCRRRELCERLAAALLDRGDGARPAGLVRIALWQLEAGTPVGGRGVSFAAAAHQALRDGEPRVAERLARAAFDAEPTSALVILAEALEKQGRHVEAIRLLDRVEARGDAGALTLARAATGARPAAAGPSEGDASGGEVPATEAWALFFESRLADSVEVARTVLGRPDATMRARVWAATAGAAALGLCGRSTEARAAADAGSEAAESSGSEDPWTRPEILWARVILLVTAGRLGPARDLVEQAAQSRAGASAQFVGMGLGFHGLVARLQGHHGTAVASLRHAVELLERADMYRFARLWLAELAAALAAGGDAAAAGAAWAEAEAHDPGANRVFDPWIALDGAWVCAAAGRDGEAVDRALAAAEEARALGQRAFEVIAAYDVARLGRPDLVVDRLGALVPLVDGDFAPACRRAALALAGQDPAGLTDCSRLFEELGHDLLAAEAATAAFAFLDAGPAGSAGHAAARAHRLGDRCPGVTTPLLALRPASAPAA
jgi:tetratricopeptide (TPR) repeat protein